MTRKAVYKGLEDVVASESSICFIDGRRGVLLYRGYDIRDLAEHSTYEEVAYLLLYGKLPNRAELNSFSAELANCRELPQRLVVIMENFCRRLLPIDALRSCASLLKCYDPVEADRSVEANITRGIDLIAKFPTIVAYYYRINQGRRAIRPDKRLGHAENFLYMLHGKRPGRLDARIADLDMVLHAEHEFNASTFAARVTASTLSDMYAAITTAVGTLEGPLHGGAASAVVRMLEEIGDENNVEKYVKDTLAKHGRIMGVGHRIYKTLDPRVVKIRELARQAGERRGDLRYYKMLVRLEESIRKAGLNKHGIYPNVDLYTGAVYRNLGIPEILFDPMFALGRIAGWVAHVVEQYGDNRLIRPVSYYTGKKGLKYVPIGKR
ncbi:MAG: citrate synthase [Candidatus Aenigmarchaeota archaeon]|nr:citrate synthase [Candidatus Aenigmarchaeota archaeon]